MCAWYCVSTSQFIWLISFISWNMKKPNCCVEMTSIEGHVILHHRRPRPHSEYCCCQCGCFEFQHLVLRRGPLATYRDHLGGGLVGCMSSVDNACVWKKERRRGRGNWQTAWPGCQLPLGSHYDFSHVQAPFPGLLQTSARLRYCSGGQLNVHLTERLRRKSPERKQKWSEGPFPTLFLAPVCPRRLKRTLPKQRVCLCRCPNSQPTHICTLAQRQRRTHAGT